MSDRLSVVIRAHAKINVGLAVLAREASGFHQIETVFCALELADELEITPGGRSVRLRVEAPAGRRGPPPDLGPDHMNLAVRAAHAFLRRAGLHTGAAISLTKHIPTAGGLGGGSSDAAAVLTALNRLHAEPLSRAELLAVGASLGSDVPFFLAGSPLARAWGRGSRIMPLTPLPPATVLLLVPPTGVVTGEAYAELAAARTPDYVCPAAVLPPAPRDWSDLADVYNDFEPIIFRRLPLLADARAALEASGALLARMTGSGSTLFGIFPDDATAARARSGIAAAFPDTAVLMTRTLDPRSGG